MLSSFFVIFFGRETEVQHGRGWQIRQGKNSVGDGGNCLSDLGWEKAGIFLTSPKPRRPKGNVRERMSPWKYIPAGTDFSKSLCLACCKV